MEQSSDNLVAANPEAKGSGSEMEMFVAIAKVRYGSATKFDPLMEEKGGRISGEARHAARRGNGQGSIGSDGGGQ